MNHLKKFEGIFDDYIDVYPYDLDRSPDQFKFIGKVDIMYKELLALFGQPHITDENFDIRTDTWYKNSRQRTQWTLSFSDDRLKCQIYYDWYNSDNIVPEWNQWNIAMNFLFWKTIRDKSEPVELSAKREIFNRLKSVLELDESHFIDVDDIHDIGSRRVSESMFDDIIDEENIDIKVTKEMYLTGRIAGMYNITFDELCSILGDPMYFGEEGEEDFDKTQIMWSMKLDDFIPCSIYDYKTDVHYKENNTWSIGGVFDDHTDIILTALKSKFRDADILTEEERMEQMMKQYRDRNNTEHIVEYNEFSMDMDHFNAQDLFVQFCREGNLIKVIELVKKYDVNKPDKHGWLPLNIASRGDNVSIIDILLKHGADVNAKSHSNWTPLMHAAQTGNLAIVKKIVEAGADVNIASEDDTCVTALEKAMNEDHTDVFMYLLAHPDTEQNLDYVINYYIDASIDYGGGEVFAKELDIMQKYMSILDESQEENLSHEERLLILNMI